MRERGGILTVWVASAIGVEANILLASGFDLPKQLYCTLLNLLLSLNNTVGLILFFF
jgi:hypothetical protein